MWREIIDCPSFVHGIRTWIVKQKIRIFLGISDSVMTATF
jgi:phosphoenolpyruvate carboxylase